MTSNAPASGQRKTAATIEGDPRERPEPAVLCVPGTESLLSDVALKHMDRAHGWYRRGGRIVQLGKDDADKPTIVPVSAPLFAARMSSLIRWQKYNKEGDVVECGIPKGIASAAFEAGHWPTLPPLVAVSDVPVLRPDGSLWQTPGYDQKTRVFYEPSIRMAPIPARISADEAHAAMMRLVDLVCDIQFEREEMRYVWLSAIAAIVFAEACHPQPAHLFTAPQPGTGKGLQTQMIAQVALGKDPPPFHFPLVHPDDKRASDREEEQEKRLAMAAVSGVRALFIDNVPNGAWFGGPIFDRFVVAEDTVPIRILGRNDAWIEVPWRTPFIVNGNHVHVPNDSRRRVWEAKIVPTCSNPSQRPLSMFKYPLRFGFCLQHRAAILHDLYLVVCHHAQNGFAKTHKRPDVSNFERFQRVITDAFVRVGGLDPSLCILTVEDTLSGDEQLVGCAMRVLEKLGAHANGNQKEGITATMFLEGVWTSEWLQSLKDNHPAFESDAVMDAREVLTVNWRLQPSKRPGAKAISSRLGDLCGRVIHGAQVWPSDDPSGFQNAEWRIAQHIDRKNQPRYTLVPPRGT